MQSYNDVLLKIQRERAHLLLGNGFSIACSSVFYYGSLFDKAVAKGLSTNAIEVFKKIGTNNFEGVMHSLDKADWIGKLYAIIPEESHVIHDDVDLIKKTLIEAIAESHLEMPSDISVESYKKAIKFFEPYFNIFTTNYDLLPYWIDMNEDIRDKYQDGFRSDIDDPDADYVVFSEHTRNNKGLFFMHGALHLYQVLGEVRKHCWERSGIRLIERIKLGLSRKEYPLFIAEGDTNQKMEQINQSSYLSYCYSKLKRVQNSIVIYGSSLNDNDRHIIDAIAENRDVKRVFIGIYDERNLQSMQQIERMKEYLLRRRLLVDSSKPVEVEYFDSRTVEVW